MANIDNLFLDIQEGNDEKVKAVIAELGVDAKDTHGRTPLINAAFYGRTRLLASLIDMGADVNAQDKKGYSALHFSAQENQLECTRLLLEHNADPNMKDKFGNTPAAVILVNWKGGANFDNLQALVKGGADLRIENNAGRSVYDILPAAIKQQLGI